ncbi:MAG TPA: peptidoglycan-binding protein, partial [Myxococcota bacterium]
LKGGASPTNAAQGLLSNLKQAGFDAPPNAAKGDLANQLSTALKQFQQVSSLQKTGQLDPPTQNALKTAGIIASPEQQQKQQSVHDGFDKGSAGALKQGEARRVDIAQNASPDTNFLDALLNKLGPGGPNEGTSSSDIKGAAAASEAQASVSEAKKGEGVNKKGSTTDAQKESDISNQQLDKANSAGVKVARGLKTEQARTDEKRRKDSLTGKDPTELGILAEEADEEALDGAGEDGKKKRGKGGDSDGGAEEGSETSGSEGGDRDGSERDKGNASSGDEDFTNNRRGNAQLGEEELGEGFYRVPTMSEQAFLALDKIVRDTAVENRATTYSWDVTFYRPGVYGAGQKAQEIIHLVVDKATAFDPVWSKAQANINILVKRMDSDAASPTLDAIISALRSARAKGGDESAATLHKVMRPMGRA